MTDQFATEVDLPAPVEEVFRHLTDPAAMVRWMGQHATLQPVPGGAFEIDINGVPVRGHYLEIDPPRRVLVSWGVAGNPGLPPGATQVEFTLTPTPAGTRLRLVHRGLPPDQAPMHATGWQHFLGRLALATAGQDPGPDPWNQTPAQPLTRTGTAAAGRPGSRPRCGQTRPVTAAWRLSVADQPPTVWGGEIAVAGDEEGHYEVEPATNAIFIPVTLSMRIDALKAEPVR